MSSPATPAPVPAVPAAHYPQCLRCNKPVDRLTIYPKPNDTANVIVEYECHGQRASQEMEAGILGQTEKLAACTSFNEYTSGLLPKHVPAGPVSQ